MDLAKAWLADFPAAPAVPYRRLMIEGAILEAEGDLVGAMQKIDDIDAAVKGSAGRTEAEKQRVLRDFAKWRADLEQKLKSAYSFSAPNA